MKSSRRSERAAWARSIWPTTANWTGKSAAGGIELHREPEDALHVVAQPRHGQTRLDRLPAVARIGAAIHAAVILAVDQARAPRIVRERVHAPALGRVLHARILAIEALSSVVRTQHANG